MQLNVVEMSRISVNVGNTVFAKKISNNRHSDDGLLLELKEEFDHAKSATYEKKTTIKSVPYEENE